MGFHGFLFSSRLSLSLTLDQFLTLGQLSIYFLVLEIKLTKGRAGILTGWNVLTTLILQITPSEVLSPRWEIGPSVIHTLPLPGL